MADPVTPNYGFNLPAVGGDDNAWGDLLNANWSSIDAALWSVSGVASAALTPTTGDARYLKLSGGSIGPNSLIVNGPAQFNTYTIFAGAQPTAFQTQAQFTGGATFGTAQVFFNSQVTFSADALMVTPAAADNSQRAATTAWVNANALMKSGGTLTGPLVLAADPTANLQSATKQYVDGARYGDNRIINGNFAVNQRAYASGTALAAAAYGHDRWKAGASGCTYTFSATPPDTTVTITAGTLTQVIEAGMIEGGVYTLSWTGTAQARVYQGTPTGSYAASPVTSASLTGGTNTIVEFNAGTLVRVKFEVGSVATPFNRQSLAKSMIDCQRYFQFIPGFLSISNYNVAAGAWFQPALLPVVMRAAPTTNLSNLTSVVNASSAAIVALGASAFRTQATAGTAAQSYFYADVSLAAEL